MAEPKTQDIELGIERKNYSKQDERAVLTLKTDKSFRGGLRSSATVYWCRERVRSHCFGVAGAAGGDDFGITLKQSALRATQAAIDRQHAEVFTPEAIASLTEAAKAHYGDKYKAVA